MNVKHAAEFKRCLVNLDVAGIRKLWAATAPEMPQPTDDEAALHTMHLARVESASVPQALKDYSKEWLAERERKTVVNAVGVAVRAPPHRHNQAMDSQKAMSDAVMAAFDAGIDLDKDAAEVRVRMNAALAKVYRGREER